MEGGQFTMGRVVDELTHDWNNIPRTVTVSSFYIDETEVTNLHWCEYLYWLSRVYGADYPEMHRRRCLTPWCGAASSPLWSPRWNTTCAIRPTAIIRW
ncbi:MAG: SUMF1/EgtB/PvdO family nonheme iron enzyme [Flavobacteriales bacterium]|nr:SUMF1/EgtB/PvdO family nonheme iron enzyme [Flavobacteriales bacterium]